MMNGVASYWNSTCLKLIHNFIDSVTRRIQHGIEMEGGLFVALFLLSLCPFDISVGVGAFVIGLSQISSFFSQKNSAKVKF